MNLYWKSPMIPNDAAADQAFTAHIDHDFSSISPIRVRVVLNAVRVFPAICSISGASVSISTFH